MDKKQDNPISENAENIDQKANLTTSELQEDIVTTEETTTEEVSTEIDKPKKKAGRPRKTVEPTPIISVKPDIVLVPDETEEITINYETCTKEELLAHISEVVTSTDVNAIKAKVALIKGAFYKIVRDEKQKLFELYIAEGGKKESYIEPVDPVETKFNEAFGIYKSMKARFDEENERIKQENLVAKQKLLEELKTLIESEEELKKTYDSFKLLQDKWKEIGIVPKSEINNLWQNYHFLVEKFYDKIKINNELKNLDLRKNLELKVDLCEKTEELILEDSVVKAFRELQKNHEKWREIGPVPQDKKEEIWERFREATDKINQRRIEYFKNLEQEQENNYAAKIILCEKAEQLAETGAESPSKWNELTAQVQQLQEDWKNIGAAPKKQNDEVWSRFRTSISNYFFNKKEFFGNLKGDQINNYNLKVNICVQAEELAKSSSWKKATEEMIQLQQEWKKIGPVPRKNADKIWKRFRTACDEFFNKKNDYYKNQGSKEEENLHLKEALIKKITEFEYSKDNNANLQVLKGFQREWLEIGYVPAKEKDRLQNEFRAELNKQFDNLKLSNVEKNTITFKSKFENIKSSSNAGFIISKEKSFLTGRLNELKTNIKLWENNIGFFANSKNADVLKKEIEEKILRAKEELKVIEEKLKFLRN